MQEILVNRAGVMGWPIGHSLSPHLHGFWLQTMDLPGSYEALPVKPEELETALHSLKDNGFRGVNLTIPHKVAACAIVDEIDAAAKRIGAINLVTVDEHGKLAGRNTDAYGFAQNLLSSGFVPSGGTAFVLGAGGACRAVIVALADMGFSEIRLANRTSERAEALALELTTDKCKILVVNGDDAPHRLEGVELLVNSTSLGMTGQPGLGFVLDALPQNACVTDIVYSPLETDLLMRAKNRGHRTIDGLGMLLHQARPAFEAFFGKDPEVTEELRQYVLDGREK